MSLYAVKYRYGTRAEDILLVEQKHSLKRKKDIPPLRLYYYQSAGFPLTPVRAEELVEYVEEDRSVGIL